MVEIIREEIQGFDFFREIINLEILMVAVSCIRSNWISLLLRLLLYVDATLCVVIGLARMVIRSLRVEKEIMKTCQHQFRFLYNSLLFHILAELSN